MSHLTSRLAATALCAAALTVTPVAHASPGTCQTWTATKVATGLGALENLEPDGHGGFYLSAINNGKLLHIDDQGNVATVLSGLDHPAGLRISGENLYFLTGNNPGTSRGTLQRLNLTDGQTTTLLTGLAAPNGLLVLPDGDLVFSQLSFPPHGIDRYNPSTEVHTKSWADTPFPNGLALSPDRSAIYTENDIPSIIVRVPLDHPDKRSIVARLPGIFAGGDDMQTARDGTLYVAGDTSGEVYAVNTDTGRVCTIARGLSQAWPPILPPNGPTSVRMGPGPDGPALYVTAIDGALRRLQPPPGIDLTPVT